MLIKLLEPLRVSEARVEELARPLREKGHEFVYYSEKTTDVNELVKRSKGADVVMIANNPYPKEVIERVKDVQFINVAFTGVDHVAVKEAKEKGVTISNAAGYSDQAVAELVLGLTLDVFRGISSGNEAIRQEDFSGGMQGREISGKTVGIIGTGNIGLKTAKLFQAFGANVIGFNRSIKDEAVSMGIQYVSLEELLLESDIVSVHLPLNEETRGFLSREQLGKIQSSAVLINCARGPIVDDTVLAELLNKGEIAGAGVDVFAGEPPLPEDHPLLHAKNAVLTPHVAYLTDEAMERRAQIAFENTLAYLEGKPQNLI
ncbi:2-hydroxyacid dehydrogenase [Lacticigenium naphthae]|uniref:2-hydroxyacid dehydrogenase n=1 Tax=Lacticigenium naphthae TaxID=515351 RepID=UPI000427E68B|nr:2-hydroxyacid dehydrogenase [Lacticigenium naphthae]